jgi:serine/threonine protein kinase
MMNAPTSSVLTIESPWDADMNVATFSRESLLRQSPLPPGYCRDISRLLLALIQERPQRDKSHVLFIPENMVVKGNELLVIPGWPSKRTPEQYIPPEAASASGITSQQSMWSLGVLLYECLTGSPPPIRFNRHTGQVHGLNTILDDQCWLASALSTDAKVAIIRLLQTDPNRRPKPRQAMAMRWFRPRLHLTTHHVVEQDPPKSIASLMPPDMEEILEMFSPPESCWP